MSELVAVVMYGHNPTVSNTSRLHHLFHLPWSHNHNEMTSTGTDGNANMTIHRYPDAKSLSFIIPEHPDFLPSLAAVAHSRSLAFLKERLNGPYFDLEAIWDEHTYFEFGDRSVEKTMGTMVQEPYVNHVPTVSAYIPF